MLIIGKAAPAPALAPASVAVAPAASGKGGKATAAPAPVPAAPAPAVGPAAKGELMHSTSFLLNYFCYLVIFFVTYYFLFN
jgi:hypothetical protein